MKERKKLGLHASFICLSVLFVSVYLSCRDYIIPLSLSLSILPTAGRKGGIGMYE